MSMEQEITAAVEWWASQLTQRPINQTGDKEVDFSLFSFSSFITVQPLTDQQIETFKAALRDKLEALSTTDEDLYLVCDYEPKDMLEAAADEAGITEQNHRFPMKTNMWIDPGCVTVSCGYAAPVQTIYSSAR